MVRCQPLFLGLHPDAALQRLLDRTAAGDEKEALTLFVRQRPLKLDLSLDGRETDLLRLACLTVGHMRSCRAEPNVDALERPLLSVGVHAERNGHAAAERAESRGMNENPLCHNDFY